MRLTLLPGGVQTFDIKRIGSRVALGRKEGSDIIINEPVVSGTHCYITVTSRSDAIIEDASTNGTYVNGVKIGKGSHMNIHEGDMLTLGKPGTATGPIGSGVCVNFRVSFDDMVDLVAPLPSAPVGATSSIHFKQEIEDLKVLVSQAEHRNDVLTSKNAEVSSKMVMMDNELKRVREDNIELTVRNDSMKTEIESLRLRLGQADLRADNAEKRSSAHQARILSLERDCAEIAQIRAEYHLTTSLREELERLRRRNNELTAQLSLSADTRRKLIANLESIQHSASTALHLVEQGHHSDTSSVATVMSPQVVDTLRRAKDNARRTVPVGYADHPVESAAPIPLHDKPLAIELPARGMLEMPQLQALTDTPKAQDQTDLLSGSA